ncbi:MAG TPA: hypothetical protein DIS66_05270, partial [Candidatus Omnitrophica bacterium]|nr:hypothetical protein [Candidatus Omnitrophota bacterium]
MLDDLNFQGDPVGLARGFPLSRVIYHFLVQAIDVNAVTQWSSEGKVPLIEISLENGKTYAFSGLNPVLLSDDAVRIERLLSEIDSEVDVDSFRVVLTKSGVMANSNAEGQFLDRPNRGYDEFYANYKRSQLAWERLIQINELVPDSRATAEVNDEELLSDRLRELVSEVASIHPSVTGAEIDFILGEFVRHRRFDGMVVLDRLNVLMNLARQIKADAPKD